MAPDSADERALEPSEALPSFDEVVDANRAIHDDAGQPERFAVRDRGHLEQALNDARDALEADSSRQHAVLQAAALLAHGIATAQAFRDGNRRTARVVVQTFLANAGEPHISPLDREDHTLARYLNAVAEPQRGTVPKRATDFVILFRRRAARRTRRASG